MKLLGICGSLRAASYNTQLLAQAATAFGPCEYTLGNIDFPLFNEDIPEPPEQVKTLHAQILAADAVIIATPEYNKNLSGVLKNALDWLSWVRPQAWNAKPVAIMSASSGITGGVRAQYSLRHCLTTFNPNILQAPEVMIGNAADAFDDEGLLSNPRTLKLLTKQMSALRAAAGQASSTP